MARPLLPDALWAEIEPLLPRHAHSPRGGRPRLDDRKALTGILFVLKTGLPWECLPAEMNCGCGMSCWRRLRDWQADGTWEKVLTVLCERREGVDTGRVKAKGGAGRSLRYSTNSTNIQATR